MSGKIEVFIDGTCVGEVDHVSVACAEYSPDVITVAVHGKVNVSEAHLFSPFPDKDCSIAFNRGGVIVEYNAELLTIQPDYFEFKGAIA